MLRTAAIASLGLRRLLVPSTTAVAPGSRLPLLLRFISGPAASSEPAIRWFLPTLDLTRGYARGRQSSSCDSGSDINDEYDYDEEMGSGDECEDEILDSDFEDPDCEYGSENDFDHDRE